MDARGGSGVHRGGGGRRHEATAHHTRYHTENGGHRAATSSHQRAPSDVVDLTTPHDCLTKYAFELFVSF